MKFDSKNKFKQGLLTLSLPLILVACGQAATPPAEQQVTPLEYDTQNNAYENNLQAYEYDWSNFRLDVSAIPQEVLDTQLHVAVSVRGLENPYILTKIEGMNMFSEFLTSIGQNHTLQVLDSGGSNAVEIDNMRQFAALAGGNAIVYSDPNESAIAPALAEAIAESGGFIGTAWNRPEGVGPQDFDPHWVIHTSADNVTNGYLTARALFEFMGGEGEVFMLEGMLGNSAAIYRAVGFERALEEFPNITVVHRDTANWSTAEALTLVETWLNVTPNVGGIWAANDGMAAGALQALDGVGRKGQVGVTGIDGNIDIVDEVVAGNVIATVSPNGFLQSGYTLAIAYAAWVGAIDPSVLPSEFRDFLTPAVIITQDNVQEFIATNIESTPTFDFTHIFYGRLDN